MRYRSSFVVVLVTVFLVFETQSIPGFPGSLDASWASNSVVGAGQASAPIGTGADRPQAIHVYPDGKVLVAGSCNNGPTFDFCIARFKKNGTLDTTFATNGKRLVAITGSNDTLKSMFVQSDGRILLAGECIVSGDIAACLTRLDADGVVDVSFGATGIVTTRIANAGIAVASVSQQNNGNILLAAGCQRSATIQPIDVFDFCLLRYTASGALDASFGSGGRLLFPIGDPTRFSRAIALAMLANGQMILAGNCIGPNGGSFCAVRLNNDFSIDTSFASNGQLIQSTLGSASARALAIAADQSFAIAGGCGANPDFCVARFSANGALDASFGNQGWAKQAVSETNDTVAGVAFQSDDKIVVGGQCENGFFTLFTDFCLVRFNANGALDTTFGESGIVKTVYETAPTTRNASADAMVLQTDGKIILAGRCWAYGSGRLSEDYCVARYDGGNKTNVNCVLDLDGDAAVIATIDAVISLALARGSDKNHALAQLAGLDLDGDAAITTTDALLFLRVAFGFRGNDVYAGLNVPIALPRANWTVLASYLSTQCGLSL
ncbi:MAG: hypothetical protein ACRCWJ_23335 [Casimicrobium sp.]